MSKIEVYECERCGILLKSDNPNLRTVSGNIYIGVDGGIVGNNLDNDGKVTRDAHYCLNCLSDIIANKPHKRD